jgi:hypothetical protein
MRCRFEYTATLSSPASNTKYELPRVVEPYSLRRTRDGNLLLYVRNDRGQLRSYPVDRIRGASIAPQSCTPRYRIDF